MKQVKVCLGRFQPFTLGHLKMATYKDLKGPQDIQGFKGVVKQSELLREQPDLKEIAKQKTVILSIYTPKDKVDTKHPFDADLMKKELEIVKKSYSEIEDIMYVPSADICLWGEMLKKAGYQASVWITGSDEAKPYVEMAMKVPEYEVKNRDNRDCDGAYTKSFYVESIERVEDENDFVAGISGTKVRQALLDGDKDLFKKMMPKGVDHLFDEFKTAVENAPEVKKKAKKLKECLNMKNITDYIYEGQADNEVVRELLLQAWNVEHITKQIESVIKSMNKKDPSTISVEKLAKSSVMQRICTACIKEEDPNMKVDSATRKEFYKQLAQEMVDRMEEYK